MKTVVPFSPDAAGFPAPFVDGRVLGKDGAFAEVRWLVDTGAGTTVVPRWAAQQVGFDADAAEIRDAVTVEQTDPAAVPCGEFVVEAFGAAVVLDVLVANLPYGLLGRDVLEDYVVTYDGPAATLTVAD